MSLLRREINFDRFVRGLLLLTVLVLVVLALRWLSPVLIPFFVAWVLAWMLRPVVRFWERRCHVPWRWLSVTLTLSALILALTSLTLCLTPMFSTALSQLKAAALTYLHTAPHRFILPPWMENLVTQWTQSHQLETLLTEGDLSKALQTALPQLWNMFLSTVNIVMGLAGSMIGVLYLLFLLMDYEHFATGWISLIPARQRPFWSTLVSDVERGMRGYFQGQALVALSNAAMFALGFWLIDLPMGIGLGIFVGLISFVPYIQVVGIVPATLLALLQMAETGRSFWLVMLLVIIVYVVVQVLQDVIFTPRIMGEITGLSPAIILLSLSVWGYAAGIVGLIVALPLTSLALSYYRRFVVPKAESENS